MANATEVRYTVTEDAPRILAELDDPAILWDADEKRLLIGILGDLDKIQNGLMDAIEDLRDRLAKVEANR